MVEILRLVDVIKDPVSPARDHATVASPHCGACRHGMTPQTPAVRHVDRCKHVSLSA